MLARTAADEHGIAEIEDLSEQARAIRRVFGEPPFREPLLREPPFREPLLREPPLREPPFHEPPFREPPA